MIKAKKQHQTYKPHEDPLGTSGIAADAGHTSTVNKSSSDDDLDFSPKIIGQKKVDLEEPLIRENKFRRTTNQSNQKGPTGGRRRGIKRSSSFEN